MNPQHAARRLSPFLAGSIVLHLAVLASAAAMRLDVSGTPAISVLLVAERPLTVVIQKSAQSNSPRVREARLSHNVPETRIEAKTDAPIPADDAPTGSNPPVDAVAEAPADASPEPAAASVELRGRIESELARFFHYPQLARREGWEGIVQLQFDVAGDGAIQNIQLSSSSGHALLDRAAREALAKAGHVTVPPSLAGGARAIALPVHYRLTEAR